MSGLHFDCNRSLRWRHAHPDANGNCYSFGIGNCHGYGNSDRYSQTYAYTTVIADT